MLKWGGEYIQYINYLINCYFNIVYFATVLLFIDLRKAFDTVNHAILVKNLSTMVLITIDELLWFKSYLTNRSQAVNVNSTLPDFQSIDIGIPQGSILGPLLFILFVSCLPCTVPECKTVMLTNNDVDPTQV